MAPQLNKALHTASHRCNAGIVCGFQVSFHGRWGSRDVTFAYGRGGFATFVAVAASHLSEDQFRAASSYEICKLGHGARLRSRETIYRISKTGVIHPTKAIKDISAGAFPLLQVES